VDSGAKGGVVKESGSARSSERQNPSLVGTDRDSGRLLATVAESQDWLLTEEWLASLIPRSGGNEHETFTDPSALLWRIKVTGPALALRCGRSRAWMSELAYLESIQLTNLVFGDEAEFLGIILTIAGARLVIRQPEVEAADPDNPHPTKPEINAWLRFAGFDYNEGAWVREADDVVLEDEHEGNFILTSDGLRPIDVHLRILTGSSKVIIPWEDCVANSTRGPGTRSHAQ
jgi:hypothetical protein